MVAGRLTMRALLALLAASVFSGSQVQGQAVLETGAHSHCHPPMAACYSSYCRGGASAYCSGTAPRWLAWVVYAKP